jgi:proton glutamate symport protein
MKNSTLIKVILAIALAVIAGLLSKDQSIFGIELVELYDLVGRLFLNALTLVVVPLVASSIISGAARIGLENDLGSLGSRTALYFALTSLIAVLVGFGVASLMLPGTTSTIAHQAASGMGNLVEAAHEGGFQKLKQIAFAIIPPNILAAAASGQMLGLLFFCLCFGYFATKIEAHLSSAMLSFWKALFQTMMKITQFVMKALPIGVFALVAKIVAQSGADALHSAAWYFATVVIGLAIYMGIVLPLILKFYGGVSPLAHFKAMLPALVTAFSTSSSAAALPIAIECVEKRVGVSNRICSFALPLGTSVTSGSALFVCTTVLFIAELYHMPLSFSSQLIIIAMSVITSFGMAGIPSASLIAVVVILQTIGLPAEGLGAILAVERFLDMFRTTANLFANSCCTLLLAVAEGEEGLLSSGDVPLKPADDMVSVPEAAKDIL